MLDSIEKNRDESSCTLYDWQLAQSAEESWRECHLHACNLLGEAGYRQLQAEIQGTGISGLVSRLGEEQPKVREGQAQYRLFPGERDLFGEASEDPATRKRRR